MNAKGRSIVFAMLIGSSSKQKSEVLVSVLMLQAIINSKNHCGSSKFRTKYVFSLREHAKMDSQQSFN